MTNKDPGVHTSVLALIEEKTALQAYTDGTIDDILKKIATNARAVKTDPTTDGGREKIRSLAYKVARSKTALDDFGKKLVSDWKKQASKVDEERRKAREFLDDLKEEVRAPLTEYENREAKRVAFHEERLADIEALAGAEDTVKDLEKSIEALGAFEVGAAWEEFEVRAKDTKALVLKALTERLDREKRRIADTAELEKLRKEKEERDRKEHDARVAKEAADKAKQEAEEAAMLEAARKELEQQQEAAKAKLAAEQLEHAKKAAEERALQAEQAAKRAQQEAEERIAEAQRVEAEEQTARERNREHRAKINNAAAESIVACSGVAMEQAKKIVTAIAKGTVPAVTVNY